MVSILFDCGEFVEGFLIVCVIELIVLCGRVVMVDDGERGS